MELGFIGLGNIGREIAAALCSPGNRVHVYDLLPEAVRQLAAKGALIAPSPGAVAQKADVIGVCVQDDDQVRAVMEAILREARPGALVLVHSTVRVQTLNEVAAQAERRGVQVIDAPVTRAAGQTTGIIFMVGGAPHDLRAAEPYLALCAAKVVPTGALGTAMTLKICNNLLTYLQMCGARDILNLANAAGLDVQHLISLTAANGIGSPSVLRTFERRGRAFVHGSADPQAEIDRMGRISEKDLDCALETGRDLGVELPSAVMARAAIRKAIAAGFDDA